MIEHFADEKERAAPLPQIEEPVESQRLVSPGEYPPLVPTMSVDERRTADEDELASSIERPAETLQPVSPDECPSLVPVVDQPTADAHRVIILFGGASEHVIQAGEVVFHAISTYGDDQLAFNRFVAVLVKANILTKRDGELLRRSPKLLKLAAIGENAPFLRSPEIRDRVRGFSNLYQVLCLLRKLPGSDVERRERLSTILDMGEMNGAISREYLERETHRARTEKQTSANKKPPAAPDSNDAVKPALSGIELVLMTPTDRDLRKITDTFIDERNIGLCGRVHERCAGAAIAVVEAPLHALPIITRHLLVGFDCPRVFLTDNPAEPDVTDASVIIVATRGKGTSPVIRAITWEGERSIFQLAEEIAPDAKSRLHVFAEEEHEGWQPLIGGANWRTDW